MKRERDSNGRFLKDDSLPPISERKKEYYQKNKERLLESVKKNYKNNRKEKIQKTLEWTENNKEKANSNWRKSSLLRFYGITEEVYNELLEKQNHCCAICGKHQENEKRHFAVDHAHVASDFVPEGAIRGLLCWVCNHRFIGKNTNPVLYRKAADYLSQHTGLIVPEKYTKGRGPKKRKKKI